MPQSIEPKRCRLIRSKSHKRQKSLQVEAKAARLHMHELLNQLSLINLGCFTLAQSLAGKAEPLKAVGTIETAVTELAGLLEKLNQSIQTIAACSGQEHAAAARNVSAAGNNVYPLLINHDRRQ